MVGTMTTTERHAIPAIACAPWCEDGDGHINEIGREDQTCWGTGTYVSLSREEVELDHYGVHEPRLGVMAYRQWPGTTPCVYLHLDGILLPVSRGRSTTHYTSRPRKHTPSGLRY